MTHSSLITKACKDVSQMISKEFPELSIFFVPYETGEEETYFGSVRDDIFKHPASEALFREFKAKSTPFAENRRHILGPTTGRAFSLSLFNKKEQIAACVFVPIKTFTRPGHSIFHLLSAAYPVIEQLYGQTDACDHIKSFSGAGAARFNMLADWFGAIAGNLITKRPYIAELAKLRAHQAMRSELYFMPENYPAPLAFDAARLIYEDMHRGIEPDEMLQETLNMVDEIDEIIPPHYINKWGDFAARAQKLAWGETEPADILGMAIHTSEDTDIRAIASIVSDITQVPANLSTYFSHYNPFTEDEANERHHRNAYRAYAKRLTLHLKNEQQFDFKESFREQNIQLIKHHPLGWCAPGIESVISTIQNIQQRPNNAALSVDQTMNLIVNHFETAMNAIPWHDIETIFDIFNSNKRQGFSFTGNAILALLKDADLQAYPHIEKIFAPYGDRIIYDAAKEKEIEIERMFGNLKLAE